MNNSHLVKVKYICPTNSRGSRVQFKCYDVQPYESRNKAATIYQGYSYEFGDIDEQALDLFKKAGLKVIARNTMHPTENVYLIDWDIDSMKKLFKIKSEE